MMDDGMLQEIAARLPKSKSTSAINRLELTRKMKKLWQKLRGFQRPIAR
jgi:hypothetical protein